MSKMINQTHTKLSHFIESISGHTSDVQLAGFINQLYSSTPIENINEFAPKHLLNCAAAFFTLFNSPTNDGPIKVSYFIDKVSDEYIALQIISSNMPFLIDSICNELKLAHFDINLVAHALIESNNYAIQIHIPNRYHGEQIEHILSKIKQILQTVTLCVSDWQAMTSLASQTVTSLQKVAAVDSHQLKDESVSFLQWLINDHFIFLGAATCNFVGNKVEIDPKSKLGLLKTDYYDLKKLKHFNEFQDSEFITIRQSDKRSTVHRAAHMDIIICKKFENNQCIGANVFLGFFTSTVYFQSVREIPLMRLKVDQLIKMYGYPQNSHNCKELITALEAFPRSDLLKSSIPELFDVATGIVSLSLIPRIKVFLRADHTGRSVSCIIFIPEKKFSTDARLLIEKIVCHELGGTVSKKYVQIGESPLTRLQLIIKLKLSAPPLSETAAEIIEHKIIKIVNNWQDDFYDALIKNYPKGKAIILNNKYENAFDTKYQSEYSALETTDNIKFFEQALNENSICFDIYTENQPQEENASVPIHLKIYSPNQELTLSSTLPLIEHLGLKAINVESNKILLSRSKDQEEELTKFVYLYHFKLLPAYKGVEINDETCSNTKDALLRVWNKTLDDDAFNSLIIACNLDYRQVNIIRAYVRYLRQTKYPLSMDYTIQVLLENAELTKKIVKLFECKFDPGCQTDSLQKVEALEAEIKDDLNGIKSINEDRAFRSLLGVILATLRTNYYQRDSSSNFKNYLSFKLKSPDILDLPLPRPYAEIFVYSCRFEGNHLRGGKIARGGLRWSDRPEDFRTEVLGLMKAQMTKNSVIVPVGSKGGFVVKNVQPSDGRDEYLAEGIACYKIFLSGLLDLTDNITGGRVTPPNDVVRYDDDDPYLVVAADKGTASFSDYANEISLGYNFWLGDAFASGGSVGYDHKKMGITAKGGWISVIRHFEDMGIDINKQEFTCIGIGDMSGDVFGNGMILSDKMKLLAAFNHIHIFLDPSPDPQKSYAERKRLFDLPRSQWTDYDSNLISVGGGVFNRSAKFITITPEVQAVLKITAAQLSPDDLIQAILKAPIDLLWNGGIGTYVKSKLEANERIGDKANDALRIDGSHLSAKVVGEGGNLGFTQLGRIEYALKGGKINTDFIDNSAGVDCSDHEVNIKIAFSQLLSSGDLTLNDRNKLLEKMTSQVAQLVLNDNYKQTQLLTLELHSNYSKVNSHFWLIKHLESSGELDRSIEFLPSDEDLQKIANDKKNLTRPELAVLLAYAKNSILKLLNNYTFPESTYLSKYLLKYFPDELSNNYPDLLNKHSLKREIIATVLVNDFINTLGCTFFHQLLDESGSSPVDIILAYVIVREVFSIDECWIQIEALDASVPLNLKVKLFNHVQAMLGRNITWLLKNYPNLNNIDELIEFYEFEDETFSNIIDKVISSGIRQEISEDVTVFNNYPQAMRVARMVEKMRSMKIALDIIYVAKTNNFSVENCARIYYQTGDLLYIRWLIGRARDFVARQYLQIQAMRTLVSELLSIQMAIVAEELKASNPSPGSLNVIAEHSNNYNRLTRYVKELMAGDTSEAFISKLTIAVKYLRDMSS